MSFFVSEAPLESTRLVLPRGAPPSTRDDLVSPIHFIQASIPFFCCSGVEFFIILSNSAPLAMYKTTNFFIGASFHWRLTGRYLLESAASYAFSRRPTITASRLIE